MFSGSLTENSACSRGHSNYGLESTIISIVDKPKILRLGTVPKEEIEECIHIKL